MANSSMFPLPNRVVQYLPVCLLFWDLYGAGCYWIQLMLDVGLCNSGGKREAGVYSSKSPWWIGNSVLIWQYWSVLRQVVGSCCRIHSQKQLLPGLVRGIMSAEIWFFMSLSVVTLQLFGTCCLSVSWGSISRSNEWNEIYNILPTCSAWRMVIFNVHMLQFSWLMECFL